MQGVRKAQIVQTKPKLLDVYIVPAVGYSEKTNIYLTEQFKKRLGRSMKIKIHPVDEIPYRGLGKFKFVISKL